MRLSHATSAFFCHLACRLDMLAPLYPVRDMRLSGQVIHTGRSSMEVAVRMEALEKDGREQTIMLGKRVSRSSVDPA